MTFYSPTKLFAMFCVRRNVRPYFLPEKLIKQNSETDILYIYNNNNYNII